MKIGKVSNNFIRDIKVKSKLCQMLAFKGIYPDVFVHHSNIIEDILGVKNKFGIEDYTKLSVSEFFSLRKLLQKYTGISEAAEKSIEFGLDLKNTLDKEYGENNYVFCSIGTSPAGIGRVMEFSGVETKYLPISNLRKMAGKPEIFEQEILDNKQGKKAYTKFLARQGLTKQNVKKSGKNYLFFDYTFSGSSLKYFEKIMDEFAGINKKNCPKIEFLSLNKKLEDIASSKNVGLLKKLYEEKFLISPYQYSLQNYIKKYIESSDIAKFSGVPHLPYENLHLVEFVADSSINSRLFNFAIIDKLAQKGKMRFNPKNKSSL